MRLFSSKTNRSAGNNPNRRGNVVVLAAAMMVMIMAFVAFTVDLGYIALTKTELQTASDAATLAAAIELQQGFGPNSVSAGDVTILGRAAAADVAAKHPAGDVTSAYLDTVRDVRFGKLEWDANSGSWKETWGASPYNLVEVTLHRDQPSSSNGDGYLPLFFAPVIGHKTTGLNVSAQAALLPATGFKVPPGSSQTAGVVPIAIDEGSWDDLMNGGAGNGDNFSYNPLSGSVSNGSDGVMEINIYPDADPSLPSGNRGTVDFGSSNNSTADLSRQILHGLNDSDLSYFPNNEFNLDNTPIDLNGDTGISNGIKDELADIIGQPRAFPIFSTVSGNGNNATYTIVKFVGATIVDVKMSGNPKRVVIQPTTYIDSTAIRSSGGPGAAIQDDTVFAPLFLYR